MRNIKLIVQYDGAQFHGFQRQPGVRTVQGELEAALERLMGGPVQVCGAGRTDAGVHARGQVVNFLDPAGALPPDKFPHILNPKLPNDLNLQASEEAPADFNARLSAKGKEYHYKIYLSKWRTPDLRGSALHVRGALDWEAIGEGCRRFIGEHDFTAFSNAGSDLGNPVKRIERVEAAGDGPERAFVICGSGFLYRMARNMTGMLLEIGKGRRSPDDIDRLLRESARKPSDFPTPPPYGLYLMRVFY